MIIRRPDLLGRLLLCLWPFNGSTSWWSWEAATFTQYLNLEGGEGWELVTGAELGVDDVGPSLQHLVFRRELAAPTWDR